MINKQNPSRKNALKCLMFLGFGVSLALSGLAKGDDSSTRLFKGIIESLKGERLSGAAIHLTNLGQATSSPNGEFAISISSRLKPGDPVEISVEDGWVIASPWEGRAFVPPTADDTVRVQVLRKGDPSLISNPDGSVHRSRPDIVDGQQYRVL